MDFFLNTLSGWQWAMLAVVPPAIVALYFLKLRRKPIEVPSTYLWKRSIEDLHVNSLWQRLRQNLLMFLQLLLIALAMLALLRPGWEGTKLEGDRFIFLVDNSASMASTDVEGAKNRLDEAKKLIGGMIDQMSSGMTAMIISFADAPQVVQEFTDNHPLLRERLATIEPSVRGTDLRGALDLADGLANPGRITTEEAGMEIDVVEAKPAMLYIFSDGRFDDVKGFSLGNLEPVYVPIGTFEAENLAITALATRRSESKPEERQAFVQVSNFTDKAQKAVIEVTLDGRFMDAKEIEVPAGESGGVVFPLAGVQTGKLHAKLKYDLGERMTQDVLAQDDTGYAAVNEAKPGRVLVVTPGNRTLTTALQTSRAGRLGEIQIQAPSYLETDEYRKAIDSGAYNLVIYDQVAPKAMPRANTVFIGQLPPGPAWREREDASGGKAEAEGEAAAAAKKDPTKTDAMPERMGGIQIIDWDRAHPLLTSVELGNIDLIDSFILTPPAGASVLIDSTAGPIAAIAPRDAYQDAVLGFEIVGQDKNGATSWNTNWPMRLSFPTFWLNALEYLAGGTEDSQIALTRPGRPVELRVTGNVPELTVVDPKGKQYTVKRSAEDMFAFHDTQELGVYDIRRRDQLIERFAVNLFDRQESDVRVRPTQDPEAKTVTPADIHIGHSDVKASLGQTPSRKEAWKAVLAIALFVLVFEWYIYNRRVYL